MIGVISKELKKYLDTSKMYHWKLKPNASDKAKKEWENIQKSENDVAVEQIQEWLKTNSAFHGDRDLRF